MPTYPIAGDTGFAIRLKISDLISKVYPKRPVAPTSANAYVAGGGAGTGPLRPVTTPPHA